MESWKARLRLHRGGVRAYDSVSKIRKPLWLPIIAWIMLSVAEGELLRAAFNILFLRALGRPGPT